MFNPTSIKADFPILSRQVNNKPLTYLDNAATSQKPEAVLQAMDEFYRNHNANPNRGVHQLGEDATAQFESARQAIARFIGATDAKEVVFTKGTTEAINLFAHSWTKRHLPDGGVIVLTEMEHHANIVPWYLLAEERQLEIRFVKITDDGLLDLADLKQKLVGANVLSLAHVSNVLGTVNPVPQIAELAHDAGAIVVLDAAQSASRLPLDVKKFGVDFLAFSGHKMLGPTGIGVLWGRADQLAELPPFLGGGQMIQEVDLTHATYAEPPYRFEAGTMPVAEAVGLHAAIDYLSTLSMDSIATHEEELAAYAAERLNAMPGVTVYGPTNPALRIGLVSFTVDGVHAHDLATLLDQDGIAIRSGHHCAQPLHKVLGVAATARASFSVYNSQQDVDALITGIESAKKVFNAPAKTA